MSRLEELEKAVYETGDAADADAAWDAYGAYSDTYDAALDAYYKAKQELKAYKKEHGL